MNVPTMVRNTTKGPTVFSDGKENVEWAGAGDVMGNDLQPVPEVFLQSVHFHRMVSRGIFEIVQAPEDVQQAIELHKQDYQQRMARQQNASQAALDMTPADDSLMLDCVGPSDNGRGTCGTPVPIKANRQAEQPPLCPRHVELAGQFVSQESDEKIIGGKPQVKWFPIRVGATERQN